MILEGFDGEWRRVESLKRDVQRVSSRPTATYRIFEIVERLLVVLPTPTHPDPANEAPLNKRGAGLGATSSISSESFYLER